MRSQQRKVRLAETVVRRDRLVPEGIQQRRTADRVESIVLVRRQLERGRGEVVRKLLVRPRTDDHARHAGTEAFYCRKGVL